MRKASVLAPVGRPAAVLLAVLFTIAAACSTPPPPVRTSFEASGDGALEVSRPGGMQVKMGPGTFAAGTVVGIDLEKSVPAVAAARLIGEALSLSAPTQPAKPVTLRAKAPEGIDPALVVGVLWSKDRSRPETVPVYLEDGYLTALVPHFSVFAFFHFDAVEAFHNWLIDQMQQFFNDFIGQPYQCKTSGANDSKLLRIRTESGTSLGGILEVGSMDAAANTVRFSICNQRHYFMAYAVDGAGRAAGLLAPRSTMTVDVSVAGHAGDRLNVDGSYSGEARFRTALYLLIAGLPAGSEALKLVSGNDFTELVSALPSCIPLASAAPSGASPIDLIKCIVGDRRAIEKIITLVTRKLTEAQRLSVEGGAAYGKQALKFLGLLETQALAVRVIVDVLALPPSNVGIAYTLTSALPARTPTPTATPVPSPEVLVRLTEAAMKRVKSVRLEGSVAGPPCRSAWIQRLETGSAGKRTRSHRVLFSCVDKEKTTTIVFDGRQWEKREPTSAEGVVSASRPWVASSVQDQNVWPNVAAPDFGIVGGWEMGVSPTRVTSGTLRGQAVWLLEFQLLTGGTLGSPIRAYGLGRVWVGRDSFLWLAHEYQRGAAGRIERVDYFDFDAQFDIAPP